MEGGAAHNGPKGKPFVLQIENTGSSRGEVAQRHRVGYGNASDSCLPTYPNRLANLGRLMHSAAAPHRAQ
jgi:hypothetical protein